MPSRYLSINLNSRSRKPLDGLWALARTLIASALIPLFAVSSMPVSAQSSGRVVPTDAKPQLHSQAKQTGNGNRSQTVSYPLYGIDFSPYENGQDPNKNPNVSADQIRARLQIIAPYTAWVRSFSVTTGLENIPPIAHSMGLKVAAGAWISSNSTQNNQEIGNLISAANAGNVDVAIVGSEVLLRGDISEAQLLAYMAQVRAAIPPNIPVTTADTYGVLLGHPNIIAASDVIYANFYPYWEGKEIDYALCALVADYNQLIQAAGSKQVIISEAGWPSGGNAVGAALPTPANAAQFFLQFVTWARANNVAFFYFEAFNEEWKVENEGPQGAYWGIFDEYGTLKPWMQPVFDGQTLGSNCTGVPCGPGNPSITFTYVPPYGALNAVLEGQECHVPPGNNAMAVYIKVNGGWWTKPYFSNPATPLNVDGSWTCNIRTGGIDEDATDIAAFLIPSTYSPPLLSGAPSLPQELYQNSLANLQTSRSVNSISGTITAGGYALPGVTVSLTGAENQTTQTAPDGNYSFYNLSFSGPYTVTPTSGQFTFNPQSQTFQTVVGNQVANFSTSPVSYLLTVGATGSGTGTIASSDSSINCGAACSYNYIAGDQVVLTASANQGSVLTSWTGCDLIQQNRCTVSMNSNRALTANFAPSPTLTKLHDFTGGLDGSVPYSTLVMDKAGNLYGTTLNGGVYGYGGVFQLKKLGNGWSVVPLYSFKGGNDGAGPLTGVVFGPDGALYGATTFGGGGTCQGGVYAGCGTVFRLTPPVTVACKTLFCPWNETVLHRFTGGSDGLYPMYGPLVFDNSGNIYGTTYGGGGVGRGAGVVYELTRLGNNWIETILYAFSGGPDGGLPFAGVILDSSGNLYGTTVAGGNSGCELGCGTVFQLTLSDSHWTENVLYTFTDGTDGGEPYAGVALDGGGNLYGATGLDGALGGGTLFQLAPSNGKWLFTLMYSLAGYDSGPQNSLLFDPQTGNLYGTTLGDGANGWGSAFKLTPSTGGWTYESLYDFTGGADGSQPYGSLLIDSSGNLYGTTAHGGNNSQGVIFQIKP